MSRPALITFINVGDSASLSIKGYYSNREIVDFDGDISFSSTNPDSVSVDENGRVIALSSGGADIVASHGEFSVDVPIIVYGEIKFPPKVDPDMIGIVSSIDPETPVVLNRVVVDMQPGCDFERARILAESIGGEVVFSFGSLNSHMIEFDPSVIKLEDALTKLESNPTVKKVFVDPVIEIYWD